ncbi:Uncharacterised protein [uncultured archaeon]|nr:Uncharacterised protein [uncultured archaeon]
MKILLKMIKKLAEIDCLLLEALNREQPSSEDELAVKLNKCKASICRSSHRLQKANLVIVRRRGKVVECSLNRNKRNTINSLMAIWKKCKQAILDNLKSIIRIHDVEAYAKANVEINYFREQFSKPYFPNNRVCRSRNIEGIGSAELTLGKLNEFNSSVQIFIHPFYLVVDINIEKEELDSLISNELRRRYRFIKEELAKEGVILSDNYGLSEGALAINDDYFSQIAIRNAIKIKNELDESNYGIPEFEAHKDSINAIWTILQLRKFCIENKITEYDLSLVKEIILEEIRKRKII